MKKYPKGMAVGASLLFLFGTGPMLAQDFEKVQIETVPVAGNISMLIGAGGNIAVSVGEADPRAPFPPGQSLPSWAVGHFLVKNLASPDAAPGRSRRHGRGRPNSRVTSRHFDYGKSRRVFMSRSNRPYGLTCSHIRGVRAA